MLLQMGIGCIPSPHPHPRFRFCNTPYLKGWLHSDFAVICLLGLQTDISKGKNPFSDHLTAEALPAKAGRQTV